METTHIWKKYLNQSEQIPRSLEKEIKENILLYGFVDLDNKMNFIQNWLVLTKKELILCNEKSILKKIKRAKIARVVERTGLSSFSLTFIEADDLAPLLQVFYSHRQKIALGNIKFVVEGDEFETSFLHKEINKTTATKQYQESVLRPILDAQNKKQRNGNSVVFRLIKYLSPYKKEMEIGMLGAILATAFTLLPPYLSGHLIDKIVKPFQEGKLEYQAAMKSAWVLIAMLLVSKVMKEVFLYLRLNKMSIIGERVSYDLRKELYSHIQSLGMDFFSKKQTGSIISRVSSDTDRIWDFIAFGVVEVSIAILMLMGLSGVLLYLDWRLALFMVIPIPLFLYAIYLHGERMKKMFIKIFRKWSGITEVLSDTIPGIQVVKAFSQEKREIKRFSKSNKEFLDECNHLHDSWTLFWPCLTFGIGLTGMGVLFYAIPRLLGEGSTSLSAGTFVSFLLYMTMFSAPIEIIGQMARMLNRATSSAYRIFEILDTEPTIKEDDSRIKHDINGEVTYRNVSFSYDGIRPILKRMNFKVHPGEMIGLVGPSGGGKSTITKLVARFFDPSAGEILIDGMDYRSIELSYLREQIGMVLQDPYLFHGTIADNISYGVPNADISEVIGAAKVANAHDFIGKLSEGYETVIGERGHTLSGGERQRISIARAILSNPKILILDEATSAVDTETEHKIQEALDRLVQGRTVFAIAHRLSTLRKADRIFVIEDGSLIEQGTHRELLKKDGGVYQNLQHLQKTMNDQLEEEGEDV